MFVLLIFVYVRAMDAIDRRYHADGKPEDRA